VSSKSSVGLPQYTMTNSHYSIIVRISAEVTKPREDRPFDGLFNINLELTAMGSPAWENGRYLPPNFFIVH
jgi:exosome complex component RRP45